MIIKIGHFVRKIIFILAFLLFENINLTRFYASLFFLNLIVNSFYTEMSLFRRWRKSPDWLLCLPFKLEWAKEKE